MPGENDMREEESLERQTTMDDYMKANLDWWNEATIVH